MNVKMMTSPNMIMMTAKTNNYDDVENNNNNISIQQESMGLTPT